MQRGQHREDLADLLLAALDSVSADGIVIREDDGSKATLTKLFSQQQKRGDPVLAVVDARTTAATAL